MLAPLSLFFAFFFCSLADTADLQKHYPLDTTSEKIFSGIFSEHGIVRRLKSLTVFFRRGFFEEDQG
jgi:hypothetical protein